LTDPPDEVGIITIGGHDLKVVPTHYLDSLGNLFVSDTKAKIFFSGDIGAALLAEDYTELFFR
jgi:flavorubredoxin